MASRRAPETKKKNVRKRGKRRQKISDIIKDIDYKKIYEESPSLQRIITNKGIIIVCNDAYAKALGYTKKEIIGKSIFSHVAVQSLSFMRKSFQIWKKNGFVDNQEVLLKRKDGSTFSCLLSGDTLYDEQGRTIGRTAVLTDLTEIYNTKAKLEENEKRLREQYEQLKKLSTLKDDFLTMITHELKTPLVPIKAFIDILISEKLGMLNSEQQKRLEIIKSSTNSLLKLVSDLLDAQKLELGLLKMNKDIHDLSEIIRLVVNRLKPNAEKKNIIITTHLQESLSFFCDNSRIEQVISNLINNSLDFCLSQDGKIDIMMQVEGGNIEIIVRDNGIGIAKEDLDNVFVKFYQRDTSVTREHGGTGIGLSVCKGIVEAHGGKIWIESEGKNKGTEIHILFSMVK